MPIPLHSPERPQVAGKPAAWGFALPLLYFWPLPNGNVRVGAMLLHSRNSGQWHTAEREASQTPEILAAYAADPEGLLLELFGYTGLVEPQSPPAKGGLKISLTDLGI